MFWDNIRTPPGPIQLPDKCALFKGRRRGVNWPAIQWVKSNQVLDTPDTFVTHNSLMSLIWMNRERKSCLKEL